MNLPNIINGDEYIVPYSANKSLIYKINKLKSLFGGSTTTTTTNKSDNFFKETIYKPQYVKLFGGTKNMEFNE
jgi:hypothetical protein